MNKAFVNGISLAYHRRGKGLPLVLVHGFPLDHTTWTELAPHLEADFDLILPDLRGFGQSDAPEGAYTVEQMAADLAGLLNKLGLERAFFVGHSMGGSVALHLAQNFPAQIRAVVTGDTSLELTRHIQVMNSRRMVKLFGLRRKLAGRPLDELLRRGLLPEAAEEMAQLDPAVMNYHAEGRVEGFFADLVEVDFAKIRCPVFLTQANPEKGGLLQDAELPPVLEAHPEFEFQRFDLGHSLDLEKGPESPFWQAALEFLFTRVA